MRRNSETAGSSLLTQAEKAQRVRRITQSILTLPSLPTVTAKMLELVDNPRTSAAGLAQLIMQDQVLTARILKVANSSFYGFPREIGTVKLAVVVLGFDAVKEMGLGLSVLTTLKRESSGGSLDWSRFWQHSVAVAAATRLLARTVCYRLAGEAFVAGLLHDIGRLVLSIYLADDLDMVHRLSSSGGMASEEAEKEIFGVTHAQVGAWLAEKWNLPPTLVEAIQYHDAPESCPAERPELPLLVYLGNHLAHNARLGHSSGNAPRELPPRIADLSERMFNFNPARLPDMVDELLLEYDKSGEFLGETP